MWFHHLKRCSTLPKIQIYNKQGNICCVKLYKDSKACQNVGPWNQGVINCHNIFTPCHQNVKNFYAFSCLALFKEFEYPQQMTLKK
jgi:hypothetical protein